ncbi:hypothetical protein PROPEN_04324 [Proteus penneri ATCC 35198]|nr:hypothetical protein PROPEN_04324 [Proteus penneri ATCC 35198]
MIILNVIKNRQIQNNENQRKKSVSDSFSTENDCLTTGELA